MYEESEVFYITLFDNLKARGVQDVWIGQIEIDIRGESTNTLFLLERAKRYIDELREQVTQIWLVYDKDDFPNERFDTTQYEVERLSREGEVRFNVAWSNQCIEYWFLLHFEYLQSDIRREEYIRKLDEYFRNYRLDGYRKNRSDIFNILLEYGNLDLAIRNAQK